MERLSDVDTVAAARTTVSSTLIIS